MSGKGSNPDYLLDSDEEPLRLERQVRIYGLDDDLRHLALSGHERVLNAGCGPGAITRALARALPQGRATGVDREPKYIDPRLSIRLFCLGVSVSECRISNEYH